MRPFLALLAPLLVSAAPPQAAPARDWSATARLSPGGAYVIGNPAARTRLVEYASYTCSHCAHFATESKPVLKDRLIRTGAASLELRHLVRDALDLTAVVTARCAGPAGFSRMSDAVFAAQDRWLEQGARFGQAQAARIGALPVPARLRALADGSGLSAVARAQGLGPARLSACFADSRDLGRVMALTAAIPPEVRGTPAFFVNGRFVPAASWAALQPYLGA